MPLKRILDESGSFDSNAVAILVEAFNGIVNELGLQTYGERERAARVVIRIAHGQTDLETAKLRAAAVAELGG